MKLITSVLFGLALSAAAQAQSYVVQGNGVVLTVDQKGYLYDFNQFVLPYMIRYKGGQFYVNQDRQLTTIDENGYYYRHDQDEFEAPKEVRFSGYNYFVEKDGTAWTFDRQGSVFKAESDKALKKPVITGGTFFAVEAKRDQPARFFVVNDRGNLVESKVDGLNPATIKDGGNNWFITNDGSLFTLSREGFVYNKRDLVGVVTKVDAKGGNFLVVNGKLLAVAEDGVVSDRGAVTAFGVIVKSGHNYFITQDAKFFAVDMNGEVMERTGKYDFKNIALTTF